MAHEQPGEHVELTRALQLSKAAAAFGVLAGSSAIATNGVPPWESDAFRRINSLPNVLEPALWAPMQLGSLFGPVVSAGGTWKTWRAWRPTVGSLVVGVLAWQAAKLVKASVVRGRPTDLGVELIRRWGTPHDGLGFPSGHSAVAFTIAGIVSPYVGRRWRPAVYGAASVVALGRIHVAAHYPLDTVGGASLGLCFAYLYNAAVGVPRDTERPTAHTTAPAV